MTTPWSSTPLTRRRALAGATTVGLALPVLSACGGDGEPVVGGDSTTSSAPTTAPTSSSGAPTTPATQPTQGAAGAAGVVSTSDVPVGSGVILSDERLVVTQPTEGEIKVFDAACTHVGCPVSEIRDTITCTCHGSSFDLATGDVLGGPATEPLAPVDFTLDGDQVVLG